jgi:hypothetical protein
LFVFSGVTNLDAWIDDCDRGWPMRIIGTTLITVLLTVPVSGDSLSREMTVSARVVGRTLLTMGVKPETVAITADDVRRGYLDVPRAVAFQIRSNVREGYLVRFDSLPEPFARAHVTWQQVHVVVGRSHEAWVAQPYMQGTQRVSADVRLELSPGTMPGTYSWPLEISTD